MDAHAPAAHAVEAAVNRQEGLKSYSFSIGFTANQR
jgi:hypothetical protein